MQNFSQPKVNLQNTEKYQNQFLKLQGGEEVKLEKSFCINIAQRHDISFFFFLFSDMKIIVQYCCVHHFFSNPYSVSTIHSSKLKRNRELSQFFLFLCLEPQAQIFLTIIQRKKQNTTRVTNCLVKCELNLVATLRFISYPYYGSIHCFEVGRLTHKFIDMQKLGKPTILIRAKIPNLKKC